jgi:hypothetical protein
MNQAVSLPPLRTEKLFSVPIWQSRVPELYGRHAEMKKDIFRAWEAGEYERHRHGYGYQTPATIFFEENMCRFPYFEVLKQAFIQNVEQIVKQRVGLATSMHFSVAATLGWILVQTDEDWVSGAWHDHYPATISACYYLQVPETETEAEGALAFQRPSSQDMFVAQIQRIKPREGDFILFPSSLWHRPEPCPSAEGLRITLAMDAYIEWQHQRAEGKPPVPDEEFRRLVNESLS